MNLKIDLFKKGSGKWYTEATFSLPDATDLWDSNLLELIAEAQKGVPKETIMRRHFHLVLDEVSEIPEGKFFKGMWEAL